MLFKETNLFTSSMRIELDLKNTMFKEATSVGEDAEKMEPSCTSGGKASWYRCCGRPYGGSSKNYK